ncbi:MAG: threonine synthase [Planctomycetota bacterium]|nr:MAG: threonine synthase [Planctomycetota bacterium]
MPRFVTHLESAIDGTQLEADRPQTLHKDRPLWVRYDLEAIGRVVTREQLASRATSLWRYRELLPYAESVDVVSLGETMTPLVYCPTLGDRFGLANLWVKDESRLPTGSFKSRGLAMAVTMAREFGLKRLAIPTAGNAGGALAAYAARAGMEAFVFMPDDTPAINQLECRLAGAKTFLVPGLITDCGKIVRDGKEHLGWFDVSTLKEPYRIEGKKTMGLELAEQMEWRLPDVILYPTGGGTGLIGMWKAFAELAQLGWLEDDKRPRMVAVQSDGCAPIARAFEQGERFAEPFAFPATIASGIRVPAAVGDFMILDAVRESDGRAVAVDESRLREWMALGAGCEGLAICPETAACIGALEALVAEEWIAPDERVVIFNTGAAQKYPEAMQAELPRIADPAWINWERIAQGKST